jgi:hypothetical protein
VHRLLRVIDWQKRNQNVIANWALVVVNIWSSPGPVADVFPTWESLGVYQTEQECFAALEHQ